MRFPTRISPRFLLVTTLLLGAGACAPGGGNQDPASDGGTSVDGGDTNGITLSNLRDEVARSTCAALFRCCNNPTDLNEFFAIVANKEPTGRYASLIPRVPPNAELSEADCPGLMQEIFDADYLGSWINAANNGYVNFNAEEATACIADLDEATCGEPVRDALYDSTCFSLGPPDGGEQQRRMFERNANVGDACIPVVDGFGAYFYGTCNPQESFCCNRHESGDCITPSLEKEGSCVPVAGENEGCSTFPVQLCQTGVACAVAAGTQGEDICIQESRELLSEGTLCYDDTRYISLGICENGYCDYFAGNEKRCKLFLPNDASCIAAYECSSGACVNGVCGPLETCEDI